LKRPQSFEARAGSRVGPYAAAMATSIGSPASRRGQIGIWITGVRPFACKRKVLALALWDSDCMTKRLRTERVRKTSGARRATETRAACFLQPLLYVRSFSCRD
jgi:hypothetical protein